MSSAPSSKTPRSRRADGAWSGRLAGKLLLVIFGVVLAVGSLALMEGVLALFGVAEELRWDDPYVGFAPGRDVFTRVPGPEGDLRVTDPDRLDFFNPQRFPADKRPGAYRVFVLGGSTTAGRPYDHRVAFPHWLELYLEDLDPSRDWQVINAGAISYASYRVAVLMRELVRYEPDLFIVLTGHNEFLEDRTYRGMAATSPAVKRLRIWLSGRRFFALARHRFLGWTRDPEAEPPQLAAEVVTRLDGWTGLERYHRDEEQAAAVVEHFAFNLERMVALAEEADAGLMLITPASNLKDFSPFKSQHGEGVDPTAAARVEALTAEARRLLGAAPPDPAAARAALAAAGKALAVDPRWADAHFRRGRALLALDRVEEAGRALVAAKEEDVAPLRALEPVVERIRRTARDHGLPLVELPALAEAASRQAGVGPIPGDQVFLDHVHPDVPLHSRLAEALVEELMAAGVARPRPDWDPAGRGRIFEREVARLDRRDYARRDLNLAKVLGWAGKLEEAEPPLRRAAQVLVDDPEVYYNLGVLLQRTERPAAAEEALERAVELAPGSAEAWLALGVTRADLGRPGVAVEALERALELRSDYPEARHNLGVVLRGVDPAAAVAQLEAARRLQPEASEVHVALGVAYRRAGRPEEALAALERAVELAPGDAEAWTELAVSRLQAELPGAAAEALDRALTVDPGHVEAWFQRGLLAARRQDSSAAEAAYRRALELDPGHARAANNLGILRVQGGDPEEGVTLLQEAVTAEPAYAEAWFNLGVALDNLGRRGEARQALERALELEPDQPRFHYGLGLLLQALGEKEAARRHLERAEWDEQE